MTLILALDLGQPTLVHRLQRIDFFLVLQIFGIQTLCTLVLLIVDAFNPLDHSVFQTVFGMIMTLLIAMEFKHSIIKVVMRKESIIQVKTVLLIALLALSRKFIILEPDISPGKLAALAATTLALGVTYWLLRERDDRLAGQAAAREGH